MPPTVYLVALQAFSSVENTSWTYYTAGSAVLLGSGAYFFSPWTLPVAQTGFAKLKTSNVVKADPIAVDWLCACHE